MILVFGAAGFIGTYLSAQLLADGYDVGANDLSEIGEFVTKRNAIADRDRAGLVRMPFATQAMWAEQHCREAVTLPLFRAMTDEEHDFVLAAPTRGMVRA